MEIQEFFLSLSFYVKSIIMDFNFEVSKAVIWKLFESTINFTQNLIDRKILIWTTVYKTLPLLKHTHNKINFFAIHGFFLFFKYLCIQSWQIYEVQWFTKELARYSCRKNSQKSKRKYWKYNANISQINKYSVFKTKLSLHISNNSIWIRTCFGFCNEILE